jgi:hypothetical protein
MTPIASFLYKAFDSKKTGWLLIMIATLVKSFLDAQFSSYEADKSFYLLLAKSISEGEGLTIPAASLIDPGVTVYTYHPSAITPVYSLIVSPLLQLFPGKYFLVTLIIELLSWLFLFAILRKLVFRITQDHFISNLFILFSGFFLYNIELSSSYKDVPAVALLLTAFLRCLDMGSNTSKLSAVGAILTSLLFILPGLLKLTYLPLAVVFPVSILLIAFLKQESRLLKQGTALLAIVIILLVANYFYFQFYARNIFASLPAYYAEYWSMSKTGNDFNPGFFPSNILKMYHFIPASVANLDVIGVQVKTHFDQLLDLYFAFTFVVHYTGILGLTGLFLFVCRKFYKKAIPEKMLFFIIGTLITLSLIVFLCCMSLRHQAIQYKGSETSWTYVMESKPYLLPILFLQICLFVFLFAKKQRTGIMKWLRVSLIIIMSAGALHGLYFFAGSLIRSNKTFTKGMSANQYAMHLADSTRKANPGKDIWLATEMQHLDWYAKLQGQKTLKNLRYLNDTTFHLPLNTILFTAINKEDSSRISDYLRRSDVSLHKNFHGAVLFFLQTNNE